MLSFNPICQLQTVSRIEWLLCEIRQVHQHDKLFVKTAYITIQINVDFCN